MCIRDRHRAEWLQQALEIIAMEVTDDRCVERIRQRFEALLA